MKTDQEMVRWALEESSEPIIKNPYLRSMFAGGQLVQPGPGRQGYQGKPHYNIKKLKYTGDSTLRSVTKGRRKGQWAWQTTEDGKRVSKFSKKKPIVEQKGPWTARIKNKGVFYADTKVNLLKKIADYQKGLIKPSKTIDYPLVEGLVFRANQQNKFKNVTDIAKEYAKITRSKSLPAFSEGSHTKNIVDLLDTREEKVERVLTDLLASDQPIDSSIVKKTVTKDFKTSPWKAYVMAETDISQVPLSKILKKNEIFKANRKLFDHIASAGPMADIGTLPLSEQLKWADLSLKGRPRLGTTAKGWQKLARDPYHKIMEFGWRNWDANEGKGSIKFFDKNGKLIKWEHGGKNLPISEVSFTYKGGKKYTLADLKTPYNKNITYGEKFFPEVINNQRAINELIATEVDDPFRAGKKTSFGKLMKKINMDAYGWSPKKGSFDILHGSLGVKGEPFTNLTFGTHRLNSALHSIDRMTGGTTGLKNKLIKQAYGNLKGREGKALMDAIIKQQSQVAEGIKAGEKFIRSPRTEVAVDLFKSTDVSKQERLAERLMKTSINQPYAKENFGKILRSLDSVGKDIRKWDTPTLVLYGKKMGCIKRADGTDIASCLQKKLQTQPEKFAEVSSSLAKSKNAKTAKNSFNLARKLMTVSKLTGWGLVGEAVFAPLLTLGPYAKGKTWKRSMSDALYGLNKKWSLGLAESEADEIRENTGQLGYDAWKMKQIDAERKATIEKLNNIEQSDTQYGRGQGSYNTFVLTDKLEKLTKEYNALSQQFLSGEVDAEGNPIGNELFDTALNNLTAGTQQIEKFDKQRVGERQQRWQKVGRTLIDKPREAFIDFTLGPNWKENLPEQQNQFYKKRYPRNPRELGQHLSYDPDIPMFAEGGIAGLLKK